MSDNIALKCPSELLLGSFFQSLFHVSCMLLTAGLIFLPLLNCKETKKTLMNEKRKKINQRSKQSELLLCLIQKVQKKEKRQTSFLRHARIARSASLHAPKNLMTLCWWGDMRIYFAFCVYEACSRMSIWRTTYLLVTLLQMSYQFITLARVQVRWQVGMHAELRVYCTTAATLRSHKQEVHRLAFTVRHYHCWFVQLVY